jgi:RNA polymerase sigma-70 factor, ECF subfamily
MVDGCSIPPPEMAAETGEVTRILTSKHSDGAEISNQLFPLVYDEMRRLARAMMNRQTTGHSLQPTDLVHNVFLKLANAENATWENKKHFMAVAARAMRSILVDHARAKQRKKRKAGDKRVPLDDWLEDLQKGGLDMLTLNEYLESLEKQDPRAVQVVEMRYFGGFKTEEIAQALGVSQRTVDRNWVFARSWIKSLAGRDWEDE